VARLISSALYGVGALDPLTFAGVFALFTTVAAMAALVPAMRAAGTNPNTALRSE
jgi:putative ABC transport system permease protein